MASRRASGPRPQARPRIRRPKRGSSMPSWSTTQLVLTDLDAFGLRGALDPFLDLLNFAWIVLGGVIFVVDIAPGGTHMLGRIDWILVVHRIGECHVAVFTYPFL